ncbi:hypothetical protein STRDD11_01525 [Streptococcus sp. DD11]|uniref:hypothetical protein n=1 Tax=Streptococcus sp. DD11 TaxID=1777879 RepID=UPI00079AA6C3|nr:hypothetical protein [Streptococcus sp. DD11]KXT83376.1 hypothetical protein STRDD11_01525 [Streptococcus sp. DD11]
MNRCAAESAESSGKAPERGGLPHEAELTWSQKLGKKIAWPVLSETCTNLLFA